MKTLLLNSDYQPLAFIPDKRAIKLLLKEDKVDVISLWTDVKYFHSSGFIELPAVLKLKNKIVRNFIKMVFSRSAVFKRDNYGCQYCRKSLTSTQVTIDHIIPKSRGGSNTFENCVAACHDCNEKKGSRLPHEIGMRLVKQPETPAGYLVVSPQQENWHSSWNLFTNID
jgi:hypothetical protein